MNLSPLGISWGGGPNASYRGGVAGNLFLCFGLTLLHYMLAMLLYLLHNKVGFLHMAGAKKTAQGMVRFPSGSIFVWIFLYQGLTLCSARLLLNATMPADFGLGLVGLTVALSVPAFIWRNLRHIQNNAMYKIDPSFGWCGRFLIGSGEWLPRKVDFVNRFGMVFRSYTPQHPRFLSAEFAITAAFSVISAVKARSWLTCGHQRLVMSVLCSGYAGLVAWAAPYHHGCNVVLEALGNALLGIGLFGFALGFYAEDMSHPGHQWGATLLMIAIVLLMVRTVMDTVTLVYVILSRRRVGLMIQLAQEQFAMFDSTGKGTDAVDMDQMRRLLEANYGREVGDAELQRSFADMDEDGSGDITLKEFEDWNVRQLGGFEASAVSGGGFMNKIKGLQFAVARALLPKRPGKPSVDPDLSDGRSPAREAALLSPIGEGPVDPWPKVAMLLRNPNAEDHGSVSPRSRRGRRGRRAAKTEHGKGGDSPPYSQLYPRGHRSPRHESITAALLRNSMPALTGAGSQTFAPLGDTDADDAQRVVRGMPRARTQAPLSPSSKSLRATRALRPSGSLANSLALGDFGARMVTADATGADQLPLDLVPSTPLRVRTLNSSDSPRPSFSAVQDPPSPSGSLGGHSKSVRLVRGFGSVRGSMRQSPQSSAAGAAGAAGSSDAAPVRRVPSQGTDAGSHHSRRRSRRPPDAATPASGAAGSGEDSGSPAERGHGDDPKELSRDSFGSLLADALGSRARLKRSAPGGHRSLGGSDWGPRDVTV